MDRAETGRRGEAAAARFYEKQGAARFAALCAWRPVFWTRKIRCTASTILKS